MKKKIFVFTLILFLICSLPAKSIDIKEKLSQIGFNLFAEKDAKTEITKVIEKQQKYANKKNFNKLKTLYANDYINFDGISLDDYISSFQKTWDIHDKITYSTTINSINVFGNYATVDVVDYTKGTTKDSYENIQGKGELSSTAKSIYYFKKEEGSWKINADMTYSEKTALKYGSTKDMEIELEAPECIGANSQYDVKVIVNSEEKVAVIASISSEPIQYPQIKSEDIFRAIKNEGELERVITSNSEGKNEVAMASIAVAKPIMNENGQIQASVEGIAFIASRVNVLPKRIINNEQEK